MTLPSLHTLQGLAHRASAMRESLDDQIQQVEGKLLHFRGEEALLELVANLLRRLLDLEVTDGIRSVEKLLTEGLSNIFADQKLSVRIETEDSRGKIGVSVITVSQEDDGRVVEGFAEESFGGSVTTLESLLLRIAVIFRRKMRPLLLLDETMAAVADKYVDRAANFLSTLADRLQLNILLVSHDEAFVSAAKHAYRIERRGSKAIFRKLPGSEKSKP